MAKPKRKLVSMIVTVSVPADRLAGDARSQVRDILTSETTWDAHMKVRKVQPAGPTLNLAAMAAKAWGGRPAVMPKPRRPAQETPALLAAMQTQEKTNGS